MRIAPVKAIALPAAYKCAFPAFAHALYRALARARAFKDSRTRRRRWFRTLVHSFGNDLSSVHS